MTYNKIEFGEISAEEEIRKSPNLVQNGYCDYKGTLEKLQTGSQFLVIGGKGSGKSLIGQKIKSCDNAEHFTSIISLNEFPYNDFGKMVSGPENYGVAWQYIFLVYSINSFLNDHGKENENDGTFLEAVDVLKRGGLIQFTSIDDIVKCSSKKKFSLSFGIPKIGGNLGFSSERETPLVKSIDDAVKKLKIIIEACQSPNKHYIVIDGLDYSLSEKGKQFGIIMDLIKNVKSFNDFLYEYNVPLKIIVLCRSDIYDRLSDPNKNKITQSYMVKLDWYQDQIETKDIELIKLVELRARLCGENNLFGNHFLAQIDGKDIREYLLDNTRYTPRDFIQLLTILKEFHQTEKFNRNQILEAVKKYSQEYFWNEIKDELSGYVPCNQISMIYNLFRDLGKKEFSLGDLEATAQKRGDMADLNLKNVLKVLYDCGAISLKLTSGKYQCKWKNGGDFDVFQRMCLHRATYKALCLD
jgi:hypothetical protein